MQSISVDEFLLQMLHVKPSKVSAGSTMTQVDYRIEMMAISGYYRTTKMVFSTFVRHLSFTMK